MSHPPPHVSREETISALSALSYRSSSGSVYGRGPLIVSDLPRSCAPRTRPPRSRISMGIDEAGRGPVLGPMVYAAAYWSSSDDAAVSSRGVYADSKVLKEEQREELFAALSETAEAGFAVRVLHASEISRNMLRPVPYNLNAMSHDAAIDMIGAVLDAGVTIDRCYVDTVGPPGSYRALLERNFPTVAFTVEKKADAKYDTCSAASILAKVTRDRMLKKWEWSEGKEYQPRSATEDGGSAVGMEFGSGYPSDPKCKRWLQENLVDPLFCYPDLVRFSWAPVKAAISGDPTGRVAVARVEFEADEDDEDGFLGKRKIDQRSIGDSFKKPKHPTFQYFRRNRNEEGAGFFTGLFAD